MKGTRTLVASLVALALTPSTQAASDAEELSQLKDQLNALLNRIEQLETKTAQAEARAEAAETRAAATAPASRSVTSGNDSIRLSLSGHVNRALLYADDGQDGDLYHVDNDASSTRVRLIGEGDVGNELTVGTAIELQLESNSTADVNQENESVSGDTISERRLEIYFDHQRYGKLWLGQGWTASEDSSEMDLSGTALAGYSSTGDIAGGIRFRDGDGNLLESTVGDTFINLDGLGRRDRLRYDTPSFAGLTWSVGTVENDAWDTALKYSAEYDFFTLATALAYSNQKDNDGQVNGSVSALLDNGFNLTLAAGRRELDTAGDPRFYYGKLGYRQHWFRFGETALSLDYHRTEHAELSGDKGRAYGLQAVQNIDRWATEAYLGYRNYDLSRPGVSTEDIDALLMGARIKF
ncbi:porin [Zobellella denitrificans]|uniref:porin n=1 Tax=Zobellella denitrificans TaxID=347534 RepID=UPI0012FE71E7|nr:porin [Zobellella denitrificans]